MSSDFHRLRTFFSRHHLEHISNEMSGDSPRQRLCFGVALLIDVTGFGDLTERYASRGAEGAELLSGFLDRHFSKITAPIIANGGDVITFAGDAAIAVWSATREDDLSSITEYAIRAALEIRNEFSQATSDSESVKVRLGMGCGALRFSHVGGIDKNRLFLVTGDPIQQAGHAIATADDNDIVVSRPVWRLLEHNTLGTKLASGEVKLIASSARSVLENIPSASYAIGTDLLLPLLPKVVSENFGQPDCWLKEFRTITPLFIKIHSADTPTAEMLNRLHEATEAVQSSLLRLEGSLHQFIMDDKGLIMLVIFGLRPWAHEDDAARAMEAASVLRLVLQRLELDSSAGVATGRAFCGVYGTEARRQYSAVGSVMNRAATLMDAARGGGLS